MRTFFPFANYLWVSSVSESNQLQTSQLALGKCEGWGGLCHIEGAGVLDPDRPGLGGGGSGDGVCWGPQLPLI